MIIILLYSWISRTLAFSSGAPDTLCHGDLRPRHGFLPQESAPPVELVMDQYTMTSDQYLRVTLRSKQAFKGFFIRAESGVKNFTGHWFIPYLDDTSYLSESRYLHCQDGTQNAVTHSGRTSSMFVVSFQWKPPMNFHDHVIFRATVVANYRVFWQDVTGGPVKVGQPANLPRSLRLEGKPTTFYDDETNTSTALHDKPKSADLSDNYFKKPRKVSTRIRVLDENEQLNDDPNVHLIDAPNEASSVIIQAVPKDKVSDKKKPQQQLQSYKSNNAKPTETSSTILISTTKTTSTITTTTTSPTTTTTTTTSATTTTTTSATTTTTTTTTTTSTPTTTTTRINTTIKLILSTTAVATVSRTFEGFIEPTFKFTTERPDLVTTENNPPKMVASHQAPSHFFQLEDFTESQGTTIKSSSHDSHAYSRYQEPTTNKIISKTESKMLSENLYVTWIDSSTENGVMEESDHMTKEGTMTPVTELERKPRDNNDHLERLEGPYKRLQAQYGTWDNSGTSALISATKMQQFIFVIFITCVRQL